MVQLFGQTEQQTLVQSKHKNQNILGTAQLFGWSVGDQLITLVNNGLMFVILYTQCIMLNTTLLSTKCRALHCVSSPTHLFLLLYISVFINTIYIEPHSNCSAFTTHQMLIRTYQLSIKDCSFLTNTPTLCIIKVFC
jgi:hypothetical protein